MAFRKLLVAFAVAGLLAAVAAAADIDGKWKSEFTTPNGETRTTTYTFKADGDKLTGTVSGRQGDTAITEGKISGDEISFVVVRNFRGEERKIEYKGKVSGDEIKLTVTFGPDMPPREMVAKRVKE
jgi:uncharacterized lipoprotein YehR (DUF1307 family)